MANELLDMGSSFQFFSNLGIIVALLLIGGALVFLILKIFLFIKKWKQYHCKIFFKDGAGNTQIKTDDGGIFKDRKTGNQLFFVRKLRTALKPDNIPFILEGRKKVVFFVQTGEKNLRPIKDWNIDFNKLTSSIMEEDVNWAIQSYEREKKLLELGLWEKILPFMIILIPTIAIMVVLLVFFKKFEILAEFGRQMATAAASLAEASQTTTLIPVG